MPDTGSPYNLRYPALTDTPDVPRDVENLADDVHAELAAIETDIYKTSVENFTTANDTSTSGTYTPGTVHGVAFVAPPSGVVLIAFGGQLGSNSVVAPNTTPASRMSDYVRTGATVGSGTDVMTPLDDRSLAFFNYSTAAGFKYSQVGDLVHRLAGLTPGASYNVTTVFKDVTGGSSAAVNDRRVTVVPLLG
jgi:hypothetical protein